MRRARAFGWSTFQRGDRWHWVSCRLRVCAGELREQVRQAFEAQRGPRDIEAVKYHLSDGRNQLKQLTDMLHLRA